MARVLSRVTDAGTLLLLVTASGGCYGGTAGPRAPVVSPTGILYEVGTPPTETRYSQTAALYLRSGEVPRALEFALEGIEVFPENPIHYFLAGVAYARVSAHEQADSMLAVAQRIYPAYELDVEPERHAAWAEAFNRGAEAYATGDVEGAIQAWKGASVIYQLRGEAHQNLAMLLSQEGRPEEAAEVYLGLLEGLERVPATRVLDRNELQDRQEQREEAEDRLADVLLVLGRYADAEPFLRRQLTRDPQSIRLRQNLASALVGQGNWVAATEIYDDLLSESGLTGTELFNVGVALFRAGDPSRAVQAFQRLTQARPNSRDAWFNYANALLGANEWEALVSIGNRLLLLDPLNENSALIVARGHLEMGDEQGALRHLERIDSAPVHVEGLLMQQAGAGTRLRGRVVGNEAPEGTPLRLRFTFYTEDGSTDIETLSVTVPEAGESTSFELFVGMRVTSYHYALSGDGS